jgi:hydroxymethylglutaryl-CoA reductase (NADPH)
VDTKTVYDYRQVHMVGGFLAGSASNSAHGANGLTAICIATGRDAANIAESHAAITYSRLLEDGDYYWSITLPTLIVGHEPRAARSQTLAAEEPNHAERSA